VQYTRAGVPLEKPNASTVAMFEASLPGDPSARRGQMFGHPCAFVNGNMFFGTFGQSVVIRIGEARTREVAKGAITVFEPMEGRAWREYVQVATGALPEAEVAALAREALRYTASLPPKVKKAAAPKKPKTTKS
jgi:hypothetical protein